MADFSPDSHEQKLLWRITTLWLPPIILLIGTVGNVLSFLVFLRLAKPNKRRVASDRKGLTVYLYLSLLAVLDLGVLYFGILNQWLAYLSLRPPKDSSILCCKLLTFLSYFFSHSSSFVLVMTLGTRFLAIYSPGLASGLTAQKNVKRLSCSVMLIFALVNAHYLYNMELHSEPVSVNSEYLTALLDKIRHEPKNFPSLDMSQPDDLLFADILKESNLTSGFFAANTRKCVFRGNYTTFWVFLDQIIYSVAPFIILCVFSVLIIRNISKFEQTCTILHMSQPNRNFKAVPNLQSIQLHINNYKNFHIVCRQFSIMLASLACCFLTFTLPAVVLFLCHEPLLAYLETHNSVHTANEFLEYFVLAQHMALLLMYSNHSSNFFVYYLTSPRYRIKCKEMFGCSFCPKIKFPRRRRRESSTDSELYK